MKTPIAHQRILAGQCPLCGKEAAPYRLCYDHRFRQRMDRALKKGVRLGALKKDHLKRYFIGDESKSAEWVKHGTPIHLPESDKRGRPRLRGIAVDVDATLIKVVEHIGRPCTIEEITAAWGRLRDRRSAPLATDLATIIAAQDKRARKMAKRAVVRSHTEHVK
jgi:hypothetical protein